ncbi:phenylalanine--tRNA ligase subunit beta [Saliphagus infecundisoli]|uniref:Phenylalanine--tRNA ligase beta subunit n=1 Tax=Saliphagus infecundisoli TaxID=1849069 RepID=A0ABD5QKM0_9EURY|nr:phenylalanine--tRNA ligase subunit beta [Saliphagus infecundisoli]
MPTVEISPDALRELTGHEAGDDELIDDLFALGLEFEGRTEDDEFELEFAPDRLDRLSVEGVARSLRYQYGDARGVYVPKTNSPEWTIEVDGEVPDDRPYVTGAVVRGVDLDDAALDSIIQLQEKLHATMGRGRAKGAIGIHDLTMLKGSDALSASAEATDGKPTVRYTGVSPDGDRFVPLDSDSELTPGEVLTEHPTGETYADLVGGDRYPAIYDDLGLFSFPPVINGRRTEVSTDSRDLFVELTGTDQWTIDKMCVIVCYALSARGGTLEEVTVEYAEDAGGEHAGRDLVRPDLSTDEKRLAHDRIESVLGIDLGPEEVIDLGERAGLDVSREGHEIEEPEELAYEVTIPPYRVDVLHPRDLIDDIGRAYGFNDLEPRYPDVSTVGGRHERSRLEAAVRTRLVGLGFEDMLTFHLTSEEATFEAMSISPDGEGFGAGAPPRIKETYSEEYTIVRTWLLPSLLSVLENNTHRAYPQDLSEVGFTARIDDAETTNVAESRHVAGLVARNDAAYEDAKARLQTVVRAFGADLETPPAEHPSFIDGRAAAVVVDGEEVGVVGEVHPEVIVAHDLEVPVAAFEFELSALE